MPERSVSSLLKSRGKQYRDSWELHGKLLQPIITDIVGMWVDFPEVLLPWMMIFNKLLRALTSPRNPDHWKDIAGYATLVVQHLREEKTK